MSGRGQERKGVATLARHRDANQRMTTRGCMPGGSWPPNTPGLPPVAVQGPLLELGGSTFRTCGSLTAQLGPRPGGAESRPQRRRRRHHLHPTDQFVADMSLPPTQRRRAEVTNADIAFERATRCVAALLGDAGPCGGKRLSHITHATTGVHQAQGVRTALHNRPAPPSRA